MITHVFSSASVAGFLWTSDKLVILQVCIYIASQLRVNPGLLALVEMKEFGSFMVMHSPTGPVYIHSVSTTVTISPTTLES